ncbi:MAG: cupin domain-containing protein [Planctomycetota bacterium]|nr:cupin domain-containing protein [Planctomycetota bacterium]
MKANVERIEAPPNASFVFRRRREPDFGFFWHRHPEVELTLIVKSRGRRFVGDSIADYEPGDLVLLGRDLPHTWHSERARRGGERADARYVQFREDFLGPAFFERPELARVKDLLARARRGLQFTGRARAKAAGLLLGMDGLDPERRLLALLEILDALARDRDAVPLSSALFEPPAARTRPASTASAAISPPASWAN